MNPGLIAAKIQEGEYVLRGKTNESRIWDIFRQVEDLNGTEIGFVQCQRCGGIFKHTRSSSNLVKHACYVYKFIKKKESTVPIIEVKNPKLEVEEVENIEDVKKQLLKLVTKWVINDYKPYAVMQDAGLLTLFQEFISLGEKFGTGLDVDQILPTSEAIESNMIEIYEQCLKGVKSEISAIKENRFGLAANIWTESCTKQSYIALTMHFLKNEVLTCRLLGYRLLNGENFTTQSIDDTIGAILADFDCELSDKSIIVTNSDGDVMKSLHNIKKLPCITQLFNNALKKSVEEVTEVAELTSACIKLVNFLKESNLAANSDNSLQGVIPSCWNSMYKILISIENNWNKISQTLSSIQEIQRLEAVNIRHLKAVTKTLQPFEEALETLEDLNEATLHLVLIYLHELKKICDENDEFKNLNFIDRLKESLQFHLDTIFTENITILHEIALFLYPPTNKLLLFSEEQKRRIEEECKRLCLENEVKVTIKRETEIPDTSAVKSNELFSDFTHPECNQSPDEHFIQELQCYKIMHVENSEDFDCFNWWQLHKDVFPFLYRLSCVILATPASSASTQQIFSIAETFLSEGLDFSSNKSELEKNIFINFNDERDEIDIYSSI